MKTQTQVRNEPKLRPGLARFTRNILIRGYPLGQELSRILEVAAKIDNCKRAGVLDFWIGEGESPLHE